MKKEAKGRHATAKLHGLQQVYLAENCSQQCGPAFCLTVQEWAHFAGQKPLKGAYQQVGLSLRSATCLPPIFVRPETYKSRRPRMYGKQRNGGGTNLWLADCGHFVSIQTQTLFNCLLLCEPRSLWHGPRSYVQVSRSPSPSPAGAW